MSLLFEHAVDEFSLPDASLASGDSGSEPTDTPVPVRPIAEFVSHYDSLQHPTEGWTCIPLHGVADAAVTDAYVGYTEHAVRGPVFIVADGDDYEAVPAETFGETGIARRIRFWHSDYSNSFQGGEKTAIVLSLVRSNREAASASSGAPKTARAG